MPCLGPDSNIQYQFKWVDGKPIPNLTDNYDDLCPLLDILIPDNTHIDNDDMNIEMEHSNTLTPMTTTMKMNLKPKPGMHHPTIYPSTTPRNNSA